MLGAGSLVGSPGLLHVVLTPEPPCTDETWPGGSGTLAGTPICGVVCARGHRVACTSSVMFLVEFIGTWGSAACAQAALAPRPHLPGSEFTLRCFSRPSKSALRGGTVLLARHPPTSGLFLFLSRIVSPSACTYVCLHYSGYQLLRTLEARWSLCVVSRGAGQFPYILISPWDRLTGLTHSSHSGRCEVDSRGFEVRVPDDRQCWTLPTGHYVSSLDEYLLRTFARFKTGRFFFLLSCKPSLCILNRISYQM